MFNRNNINIGIGLGLLIPIIGFGIFVGLTHLGLPFRIRTLAVMSICLNLITLRLFQARRANESIRGITLATVGLAIIWLIYYYQNIMSELS